MICKNLNIHDDRLLMTDRYNQIIQLNMMWRKEAVEITDVEDVELIDDVNF